MQQTFYLYRFLDDKDNVLYIGRTNNIERRIIKEHFTSNTHLPPECYLEVAKVEYASFVNESEEVAYEAILINQVRPKYNKQFKDNATFEVQIPSIEWKEFQWNFPEPMEMMKMLKKEVVAASDSISNTLSQLLTPRNECYLSFGYFSIDKMAFLTPTSMTMIGAQSNTYKTRYALSIAIANAKRNKTVLYVNLKDSVETISCWLLSKESLVPIEAIQTNSLTEENWKAITMATSFIDKLPLSFYNRAVSGCKVEDIGRIVRESQCDLVIIDDLNSIEDFENSYDVDKSLRAMNYLKGIAIETRCAIISIYCLSLKEISKRQDKRPMISDVGYASLLSYNDNIQFVYSNDASDGDRNTLEIITVKSCIGVKGTVELNAQNGNLFEIDTSLFD